MNKNTGESSKEMFMCSHKFVFKNPGHGHHDIYECIYCKTEMKKSWWNTEKYKIQPSVKIKDFFNIDIKDLSKKL